MTADPAPGPGPHAHIRTRDQRTLGPEVGAAGASAHVRATGLVTGWPSPPTTRISRVASGRATSNSCEAITTVRPAAGGKSGLVPPDIPNVEQVHLQRSELWFEREDGNDDDGSRLPGESPRNNR